MLDDQGIVVRYRLQNPRGEGVLLLPRMSIKTSANCMEAAWEAIRVFTREKVPWARFGNEHSPKLWVSEDAEQSTLDLAYEVELVEPENAEEQEMFPQVEEDTYAFEEGGPQHSIPVVSLSTIQLLLAKHGGRRDDEVHTPSEDEERPAVAASSTGEAASSQGKRGAKGPPVPKGTVTHQMQRGGSSTPVGCYVGKRKATRQGGSPAKQRRAESEDPDEVNDEGQVGCCGERKVYVCKCIRRCTYVRMCMCVYTYVSTCEHAQSGRKHNTQHWFTFVSDIVNSNCSSLVSASCTFGADPYLHVATQHTLLYW